MNRTPKSISFLPAILEAGLAGNRQRLELLSLTAIRSLKADSPSVASELGALLAKYAGNEASLRWHSAAPPPADADAGFALVRIIPTEDAEEPILEPETKSVVTRFLHERGESSRLLCEGVAPPRSILLRGLPGTGKTMLARWLARRLDLRLVSLDLSAAVSSFLGKTGSNLRRSLDYARSMPCVMLLDEFDAIAKRRDDVSEVGELKRIVNVLLKELEEWPLHSVLIAATNHPELLDPAIARRFDLSLETPLPGDAEREAILQRSCGRFAATLPIGFLAAVSRLTTSMSGSDLDTLTQSVVRRHLVAGTPLVAAFIEAIASKLSGVEKKNLSLVMKAVHEATGASVRELAEMFGKGSTTVHYHLHKEPAPRKRRTK